MTTTTDDAPIPNALQPYIFFYGRCEEALELYKSALGGSYQIVYVKDTPMAENVPPAMLGRVMHARFTAPGIEFFASDGEQTKTIDPDEGNICVALTAGSAAEGERILGALSAGGNVTTPLGNAFWGGRYAGFVDRFGIEWMLTLP